MREHLRVGSSRHSIEGFSGRQRAHHALVRDGVVVSELLADGPDGRTSAAKLDQLLRTDPSLVGAERVFIPHEQEYVIKNGDSLRKYRHGIDDGLSNRPTNLPPIRGVFFGADRSTSAITKEETNGRSPRRNHDWANPTTNLYGWSK